MFNPCFSWISNWISIFTGWNSHGIPIRREKFAGCNSPLRQAPEMESQAGQCPNRSWVIITVLRWYILWIPNIRQYIQIIYIYYILYYIYIYYRTGYIVWDWNPVTELIFVTFCRPPKRGMIRATPQETDYTIHVADSCASTEGSSVVQVIRARRVSGGSGFV